MGIKGIYGEIGPGQRIALSKLAVEKFEQTGRPLRIAIDTSIWLFQIQASKGGTNPALRTFYYRLLRLIALSIHPVFVFDGPNKPPFKRGKRTGANVASIPEFLAKQLLKQFGFPIHLAPGEAEAECALLQREGIVDAVLSEDVDTLMFGSGVTIRNWSPEQRTGKTPTHVNVYDAVKTKNGPSGLDREGMILVAMMSGGDYVPEGIPKIGIKTACEAARAGFGHDLCKIARNDKTSLREWKERLKHEIMTNESKFFSRKKPSLVMPDDFPRMDILGYYTHPVLSSQAGLDKLKRSIKWDQDLDFSGLRDFTHDAFDWVKLEGAKHFVRSLAPSLLVRQLRMRGEQTGGVPSDDLQAIEEDEALLVKGLHGLRQHAITDSTTELRVSYIPIDLVKIDLSKEEPDEEFEAELPGAHAVEDEDDELLLDDEEEGPKKRGPTKFDPSKPARAWVLETYVKVGAPLKVQDWEAARAKPLRTKRTASADATKPAPKPRVTTRRAKTTPAASSQVSIDQFAKVTKPGAKHSRAVAKLHSLPSQPAPAPQSLQTIVNTTSSPAQPENNTLPPGISEMSPFPVRELLDLPSSVTKRRKRAPIQRSGTQPFASRPDTPPLELDAIECLDLSNPTIPPSPSQFTAKKARTQSTTRVPARGKSVAASPTKTKQSTLDTWASPSKCRNTAPISTLPVPAQPAFRNPQNDKAIETLDLTLSSPVKPTLPKQKANSQRLTTAPAAATAPNIPRPRTITDVFKTTKSSRPALIRMSSNASLTSSSTNQTDPFSHMNPPSKPTLNTRTTTRSTSPFPPANQVQIQPSPSPEPHLDPLHLTHPPPHAPSFPFPPTSTSTSSSHPKIDTLDLKALSPPSKSTSSTPAPAAWKIHTQTKKLRKREVVLRNSLDGGAWTFIDVESPSPAKGEKDKEREKYREKEKARRKWRESEIEVLDLS